MMLARALRRVSIALAGAFAAGLILLGVWTVRAIVILHGIERQEPGTGHVVGVFGVHGFWWLGLSMVVGFVITFVWASRN